MTAQAHCQPANENQPVKDLYEIGEIPPLGHVPAQMYAWASARTVMVRRTAPCRSRLCPPGTIGEDEVLVLVMAAGVNYNGVWAALGKPISPIDGHKNPYHIAGSDASGIVYAVGAKVKRWKVGDEVVVHCNQDDGDDEECNGGDPMFSPCQRIWGYETPDGSFAQFARVQARQLLPRPQHLSWEESACYTLTLATAYRMLFGHRPHTLKPGQNVLVWGASGGLGSMAVQFIATAGGNAIGVISDDDKRDFVMQLGAKGVINRKSYSNAGAQMPKVGTPEYNDWLKNAREFGKAIWAFTGKGNNVDHGVRASGRIDLPGLGPGREARRHGGHLRRHHRLQSHHGCALSVDASEARAGLAFRQSHAGVQCQQAGHRAAHRSLHVGGLCLARHPQGAHEDVEERAPARQHGGAGIGAAHRTQDLSTT